MGFGCLFLCFFFTDHTSHKGSWISFSHIFGGTTTFLTDHFLNILNLSLYTKFMCYHVSITPLPLSFLLLVWIERYVIFLFRVNWIYFYPISLVFKAYRFLGTALLRTDHTGYLIAWEKGQNETNLWFKEFP